MTSLLSRQQLQDALPDKFKKTVNQELVDQINTTLADVDMYETYRDNLLSYSTVLQEGRWTIPQYVCAVKYVSHKLMGDSNLDSFIKTFPDKYQDWLIRKVSQKDISSYVSSYNKSKLVNTIYEQTLIPSWVLNQDMYQKALNTQADLMLNAKSEMVRTNAANSLLTHLKPPQTQKIELDIGMKEGSAIDALRQSTMEYVAAQKRAIESGVLTAKEAAESTVIEGVSRRVP